MEIVGKNIVLSRVTEEDLDFICQLECNKDIWRYEEEVESDLQAARDKFVRRMNKTEDIIFYDFVICRVNEGIKEPIGLAQIWQYVEFRKSWEVGYAIIPAYQGQGFGKEAVKLLFKFAFEDLGAHKVIGMCNSHNVYSGKLMESVGMIKEGVFREELYWQGTWHDQWFYSILDKEYLTKEKGA